MPALWDSKMTFVSVSRFLGLALCSPFQSVSGPFVTLYLIVSLGKRKRKRKKGEGGGKREDPKRKVKKTTTKNDNNKPLADFKPVQ